MNRSVTAVTCMQVSVQLSNRVWISVKKMRSSACKKKYSIQAAFWTPLLLQIHADLGEKGVEAILKSHSAVISNRRPDTICFSK
jgi:L,D-peptidoglycan transpeptidase YkuD (ErfK/YbiS/YcfS/YnhG family)